MRKIPQPPPDGADEPPDDALDGVQIEAISSISGSPDRLRSSTIQKPAIAPDWTKRLTTRGKMVRTLVIAVVLIAALVVLLPHPTFSLPPDLARLLTPAPTQTPQPGRFSTDEWEPVAGPPVQTSSFFPIVPSSAGPNIAYACLFVRSPENGRMGPSGDAGQLWITRDAGYTWRQATLPIVIDGNCQISPALDGSHRVTLTVESPSPDQGDQPCAHSQYLLSGDDGASWRRIQHASILPATPDGGGCQLWSTARHLFMYSYSNSGPGFSFLERSDDGGLTWRRADAGLAALNADWFPQPLDPSGEMLGALVGAKPDLWISRNAGANWQRIGPIAPDVPLSEAPDGLISEASLGSGAKLCNCIYAVAYRGNSGIPFGRRLYVAHDYTRWSPLPPLPVKGVGATPQSGTSVFHTGVFNVLGLTADGKLLALGADPEIGVATTPNVSGGGASPPPRLWAWNSHTGYWDVAETRVPCDALQTCNIYVDGAAPVVQANGAVQGTIFWLTQVKGAGQPVAKTTFRLFVPAE
jgi:hypothetical protein